jgi:hypothetical protein
MKEHTELHRMTIQSNPVSQNRKLNSTPNQGRARRASGFFSLLPKSGDMSDCHPKFMCAHSHGDLSRTRKLSLPTPAKISHGLSSCQWFMGRNAAIMQIQFGGRKINYTSVDPKQM